MAKIAIAQDLQHAQTLVDAGISDIVFFGGGILNLCNMVTKAKPEQKDLPYGYRVGNYPQADCYTLFPLPNHDKSVAPEKVFNAFLQKKGPVGEPLYVPAEHGFE